MADAFPGRLRRTLIATAAVVLLGSAGATCGLIVRSVPGGEGAATATETRPDAAGDARTAQTPVGATGTTAEGGR